MLYKVLIHCNSHYKQLYSSNKTEHLSCKCGCGVCECMHIETFFAGLGYIDEWLYLVFRYKNINSFQIQTFYMHLVCLLL